VFKHDNNKTSEHQVDKINGHKDGVDFDLPAVSWIMVKFWDHPFLMTQEGLRESLAEAITNLPMWYGFLSFLCIDTYTDTSCSKAL
jgi:hypothetical protein